MFNPNDTICCFSCYERMNISKGIHFIGFSHKFMKLFLAGDGDLVVYVRRLETACF